jgi:hypothetical protein
MTSSPSSPESLDALRLFRKVVPPSFFEDWNRNHEGVRHKGVYGLGVVVWLMIWQRLEGVRSLSAAVQYLLQCGAGDLMNPCKRWAEDKVSATTSSYCEARQKLPTLVARDVMDRIVTQLQSEIQPGYPGLQRPIFVVDGTSLQMPHTPELTEAFSPGHNQHGNNHWPVMRLVVFHDVFSGMALRPSWGPYYGDNAVSEQFLAEQALSRLPADAVVLGDGNFGILAFAHAVGQSQRSMVLRLTKARAQKLIGRKLGSREDVKLTWTASRWERKAHPELAEATVTGRLIICQNPSKAGELLYLFTTLDLPWKQILGIYGLRWNIETDLRSLKRTVELHKLTSKSLDMVEKELLLAFAAYNLVRAVMCITARRANVKPRDLSFSFIQTVLSAALPGLDQAKNDNEFQQRMERMLRFAAQGKLPKRKQRRSYPRVVWGHGGSFPPPSRTGKK